jgi:hypothetical protein
METPNDPGQPEAPPSSTRVRKRRIRTVKDSMYGVELRRRTLRIRLAIAGGVLLVVAIIAAFCTLYPGTGHFSGRFGPMLEEATGAKAVLRNPKFSTFHAEADSLELKWPAGNILVELDAEKLRASVLPFGHFASPYGGSEATARTGILRLQAQETGTRRAAAKGDAGKSPIHFDRLGIRELDVFFGDPEVMAGAAILNAEAAFYPQGEANVPRVLIYSGTLRLPLWPDFIMERAILEFPGDGKARVSGLRIRDSLPDINLEIEPGICDIAGDGALHGESTLDLKLEAFQIQALLGEEVAKFFTGRVDTLPGGGVVSLGSTNGPHLRADVVASSESQLIFDHFPFLEFLAQVLDDKMFLKPFFHEKPSMTVVRDGDGTRFENINFTAPGHMAIRGSFAVASNDAISGQLDVGVAGTIIETSTARRLEGMFSAEREKFRWLTITLGGTTAQPADNINDLFVNAPLPGEPAETTPETPAPSGDGE